MCAGDDAEMIPGILNGQMPFFEPELGNLIARNLRAERLSFAADVTSAVDDAQVVFIAVHTPSRRGDGHADLSMVWQAAEDIARAMTGPLIIVLQSTVPVGTGDDVEQMIRDARPDAAFHVAANPAFMREGSAISDFRHPDRIVIGTGHDQARIALEAVYRPLFRQQPPMLFTSRRTAELIKYAANAFLATKATFINEIADLCEKAGADVQDVARGIGLDARIGAAFLQAGPGFGGSCLPKDVRALVHTSYELGAPFEIVETVARVNDERKQLMAERVIEACGGSVQGKTIALLGLAFRPGTCDLGNAPSVPLVQKLQQSGAKIRAYDPAAMGQAADIFHDVDYASDPYDCVQDVSAVVIVTPWEAFRSLDLAKLRGGFRDAPMVIDLANIFPPDTMAKHGYQYISIGRPGPGAEGA